jgi:hypothetical protein
MLPPSWQCKRQPSVVRLRAQTSNRTSPLLDWKAIWCRIRRCLMGPFAWFGWILWHSAQTKGPLIGPTKSLVAVQYPPGRLQSSNYCQRSPPLRVLSSAAYFVIRVTLEKTAAAETAHQCLPGDLFNIMCLLTNQTPDIAQRSALH